MVPDPDPFGYSTNLIRQRQVVCNLNECIQISLNNIAAPFAAFESFCFAITLNDVKF